MARYIEAVKTAEIISEKLNIPLGDLVDIFAEIPTAEVVDYEKVAEVLRNMFDDDCACNYNGYDEWLPMKCKYAENDCPMPKERLGCWKEFVKHFLDQLNTRTPKERGGEK